MRSRSADDDLVVSSGHTAAFEALCHPGGCGPDVAFAQGMREGVGRVWPMASEHVAHPYIHSHGFSVRACGLVGVEGWVVWPSSRGPRATVSLSGDSGAQALDLVDVGRLSLGGRANCWRPQSST